VRLAIRRNMRDFIAILFVALLGGAVAFYVLSNQRFNLPAWVPGIGSDFYTVRADLPSAQAVVPGQGQTVNIAGVSVGDIGNVELRDGRAVVELKIEPKYAPIYRDASALLRSKTGLKDMYVALDPGSRSAGELPEGGRVELSSTLPDVNPDEILAELDGDTRAYLQILLNAGGQAFTDSQEPRRKPQQSAAQDLR
jgi:phospholipid/cholesterol/gamma-HCH transport system substrate-binding protein